MPNGWRSLPSALTKEWDLRYKRHASWIIAEVQTPFRPLWRFPSGHPPAGTDFSLVLTSTAKGNLVSTTFRVAPREQNKLNYNSLIFTSLFWNSFRLTEELWKYYRVHIFFSLGSFFLQFTNYETIIIHIITMPLTKLHPLFKFHCFGS